VAIIAGSLAFIICYVLFAIVSEGCDLRNTGIIGNQEHALRIWKSMEDNTLLKSARVYLVWLMDLNIISLSLLNQLDVQLQILL
jgi:hypothetical protein